MLGIVKRTEDDLAGWLATEIGFLTAFGRYDDQPLTFEPYQLAFLANESRFRWVTKSRQVGFSFLLALEALARCHLRPKHTSVFVSYNLEDAKEKVLFARHVYEDLPLAYQKKLVVDSKTELAFESNGAHHGLSRIISNPSKAPRGKKGDVLLDELAHYVLDREVYRGSTAVILRSANQLTGCSTPLGRRGVFWEIAEQAIRPYPHHWRQEVPWWLCRFFCTDTRAAAIEAPDMPTEERALRFGNADIIQQFESLALEDFQQEFENLFVDESYSYYPYDLILPVTHDDLVLAEDIGSIPAPTGRLVAGFDVGRTRDRSELAVFEEIDGTFVCRFLRSYLQTPFVEQENDLRRLLNTVPVVRLSIDRSGIGMNLAENLVRDFPQVIAENFTSESKERWATDVKILFQKRAIQLPRQRELVAQIHSIKRRVSASGNVSFDAERTKNAHADRFWAVALACQKERQVARAPIEISVRILGDSPPRPRAPERGDSPILVELWNTDAAAVAATAATVRELGGELEVHGAGGPQHEALRLVRPVSRSATYLRWALAQQGYVRRVVADDASA